MIPVAATEAHSRHTYIIGINGDSVHRDKSGKVLSFGVFVGNDHQGNPLFIEYMASHSTNDPTNQIRHFALDAVAGVSAVYKSVASHGDSAMEYGPGRMKAQAVKGIKGGLVSGIIRIATAEVAQQVLKHVTRATYYVPVHGTGSVFLAPIDV